MTLLTVLSGLRLNNLKGLGATLTKEPRCEEMQAWLRQHPDVTRYVVLDDEDDCLDELPLFQPSSRTGLTEEICQGIEEYLAGRSDNDMRASAIVRLGQNIHSLFKRDKS